MIRSIERGVRNIRNARRAALKKVLLRDRFADLRCSHDMFFTLCLVTLKGLNCTYIVKDNKPGRIIGNIKKIEVREADFPPNVIEVTTYPRVTRHVVLNDVARDQREGQFDVHEGAVFDCDLGSCLCWNVISR